MADQLYFILGRVTGMFAFLFLALCISVSIYKSLLVKKLGGKFIRRFHLWSSIIAFVLVAIHIYTLMFDSWKWGDKLTISNSLLPAFDTEKNIYLALGVIAFYLMIVGMATGMGLHYIVRKFGYKVWIWSHRLALPSYVLVYFHAIRLGTDFKGGFWYQAFFQVLFYLTVIKYIYDIYRHKQLKPDKFSTKKIDTLPDKFEDVATIRYNPEKVDSKVHMKVYIAKDQIRHDLHWYVIADKSGVMHAYSAVHIEEGQHTISGTMKRHNHEPYIQISEYN